MSDTTSSVFVRQDLVPERPAPVKTTGFIGFLRTRLFNSPTNILITIVSALLLWFIVVPALKFLLVDAVWTGKDRTACLAEESRRRGRRLLALHPGQVHRSSSTDSIRSRNAGGSIWPSFLPRSC